MAGRRKTTGKKKVSAKKGAAPKKAETCDPEQDERLAPGASDEDVREAVEGRGETVVVVGHEPDCGIVASRLGAGDVRFPPGGHCVVEL